MVKYLSFHNSSFALRYFNVNGKATMWHTPCLFWFFDRAIYSWPIKQGFLEHWALPPMEATLWTPICKIEPNVLPYIAYLFSFYILTWELNFGQTIYLSMKHYSLFCFALGDFPNHHDVFHAMLLVSSESSPWYSKGCIDVVWECLDLRCGSYWLLNHFFHEN